jgi:glycosyltransferase involved in cell wall biosynthesis
VIAADTPAHREAAGDAALLVPPAAPQALAEAIARVLSSPDLAADLRSRGFGRAGAMTWDATADWTLRSLRAACLGSTLAAQ